MNIAFFTDAYLPQISGVVTSVELTRAGLEALGHRVFIFCPKIRGFKDSPKQRDRIFRFSSFRVKFMPSVGTALANRLSLPFSWKTYMKLPELGIDIVHSHTEFGMGQLANFVAATLRVPHVHTYHTIYPEYVHYLAGGKIVSKKAAAKLSAVYCNLCSSVIAPSERVKNLLWQYGVRRPIEVIGTGINVAEIKKASGCSFRKKYNLGKAFVCLYVGRLGREKSVEILLECFAKAKLSNAKLVLVGDGPHRSYLEKLAGNLGIAGKVVFCGYLPREKVFEAYNAADIFCFASQTETQGLVILEAEAAGLPLVVREDDALREYVEDEKNAFVVNSKNAFIQSIKKLADSDSLRARMSKESQRIAQQFTIENQVKKLLRLYKHLTG
jgi:1,2-diacylglycerol 3-alpha-glucosyltransferase